MLILGDPLSPAWRGRPPAMLDDDVPVWFRFLDRYAQEYTEFFYNVRIGTPPNVPEHYEEQYKKDIQYLGMKRIDAVGIKADSTDIIEVAKIAGMRTLGQVRTYIDLWNFEKTTFPPSRAVIVSEIMDPDLESTIRSLGIILYQV